MRKWVLQRGRACGRSHTTINKLELRPPEYLCFKTAGVFSAHQSSALWHRLWCCTRVACGVAFTLSLAACATFHPRPLTAATTARTLQQRSLQSKSLRNYLGRHNIDVKHWPLRSWSTAALVMAARYYHPDIAIARERWLEARAAVRTASAYPNPSIGLLPKYTTNTAENVSPWTVDIASALTLITAGKRSDEIASARANVEAARYEFMQAEWNTDARVEKACLDLGAAHRRQLLLETRVHDTRALLVAYTAALNAGQSPPFQAFAARLNWNKAKSAAIAGHAAILRAQQALAYAIGIPDARLAQIRIRPADWLSTANKLPPESKLQTFVLTQRADVRAAVLRYAASQSRLKLAIARQYPSIVVGPGYQWDQGAHRWLLGLSLTLPVFNQNQGPIAEARARRTLRADELRALQLALIKRLKDTLTEYRLAQQTVHLVEQRARDRERRAMDDHTAFASGQIARTTWLRARLMLTESQLNALNAHWRLLSAHLRIAALIEHPLSPSGAPHSERHGVTSYPGDAIPAYSEHLP